MDNYLNNKKKLKGAILFFMLSSILIQYPLSINIFSKFFFNSFVFVSFLYALYISSKKVKIYDFMIFNQKELKIFVLFWILYYISLLVGTLLSANVSIYYLISYLSKLLIFLFLMLFLTKNMIIEILNYYSNMAFYIALISIIVGILVASNLLTPFTVFNDLLPKYLKLYGLVFYAQSSPLDFFDFPLYRLQGLSIEAGIFAIFLFLPTLYFLLIEKSILKYSILFFAMIWTYSFPPFLILLITLITLILKKFSIKQVFILFLSLIIFLSIVLITKNLEEKRIAQKFYKQYNKEITLNNKTFVELRAVSLKDRTNAIQDYLKYLENKNLINFLFGIGAGNSTFIYGKVVANGYLAKFIDSGIIGLLFNVFSAFVLIFVSLKNIISIKKKNDEKNLTLIFSITTIFLVSVSLFRQPFDSSYFRNHSAPNNKKWHINCLNKVL